MEPRPQGDPLLPETHPNQGPAELASLPAWGPGPSRKVFPAGHRRWAAPRPLGNPPANETTTATHRKKARTPPVTPLEAAHREAGERRGRAGGWKMRAAPDPSEAPGGNRKPRSASTTRTLARPLSFQDPHTPPPAAHQSSCGRRENLSGRCRVKSLVPHPRGDSLPPEQTGVRPTSPLPSGRSVSRTKAGLLSRGHRSPSPRHSLPQVTSHALLLGLGSKGTWRVTHPSIMTASGRPTRAWLTRGGPGTQLGAGIRSSRPHPPPATTGWVTA